MAQLTDRALRRLLAVADHLGGAPHAVTSCCQPAAAAAASAGQSDIEIGAVSPDVAIFDMDCEAVTGFEREQFLIEGRWLWSGVMLPWVRHSWTAALKRVQAYQDAMVLEDWAQHGWEQPPLEVKQRMLGGSGSTGRPSFDLFKPPRSTAPLKGQKPTLPFGSGSWCDPPPIFSQAPDFCIDYTLNTKWTTQSFSRRTFQST